ncbi:MAG: POTRA domain-containing protein [Halanaerobiales bacterium]
MVENPVVNDIRIEGNKVFSEDEISKWLDLKTGKTLNHVSDLKESFLNLDQLGYFEKLDYDLAPVNNDPAFFGEVQTGGANNLRGYDRVSFSGKNMMLLGTEYRFPIVDRFKGVVFADAGNTWQNTEEIWYIFLGENNITRRII